MSRFVCLRIHWNNKAFPVLIVTLRQTLITMAIALALATLLLGVNGLLAAIITLVLVWALGQALKRTLGGQTGDTLGAAIELGEVIFLLALL